ncbi:MAG TPA: DUF1801 domain-containing protein [Rhizomicrobium sp.]
MKDTPVPATVDAYLKQASASVRGKLDELRALVKAAAPKADEAIAYDMPFYKYHGRPLCSFAAYKNHIGFFAGVIVSDFTEALKGYQTAKGTVRFPLEKRLPAPLIRKLLKAGVARNEARAVKKASPKTAKAAPRKRAGGLAKVK